MYLNIYIYGFHIFVRVEEHGITMNNLAVYQVKYLYLFWNVFGANCLLLQILKGFPISINKITMISLMLNMSLEVRVPYLHRTLH